MPSSKKFDEDDCPDYTSLLPDEVLWQVFSNFDSISTKFKLAAVNKKWRRCIMKILKRTSDLNINLEDLYLNGCKISTKKWPAAVEILAKKTQFKEIRLHSGFEHCRNSEQLIDDILNIFLDTPQSLKNVTNFTATTYITSPTFLRTLAKCNKLSNLSLDLSVGLKFDWKVFGVDFRSALGDKALTKFCLKATTCEELLVSKMFQAVQPNKLEKLELSISDMKSEQMHNILKEFGATVFAAVKDIRIGYRIEPAPPKLFTSLSTLPQLQKCTIDFLNDIEPNNLITLSAAVISFFSNRLKIQVYCNSGPEVVRLSGGSTLKLIREVRTKHPNLEVKVAAKCLTLASSYSSFSFTGVPFYYDCTYPQFEEMHKMIRELGANAFSQLKEIRFGYHSNGALPELFTSLARAPLPQLQTCTIDFLNDITQTDLYTLTEVMLSFFADNVELQVNCNIGAEVTGLSGCSALKLTRKVLTAHPNLEVNIAARSLTIASPDSAFSFTGSPFRYGCTCDECRSFYPNLVHVVALRANKGWTYWLKDYTLERCRIDSVFKDMNRWQGEKKYRATGADEMFTESAKIYFENRDRSFFIVVHCVNCPSKVCVRCKREPSIV